jgi:hypothetical protein
VRARSAERERHAHQRPAPVLPLSPLSGRTSLRSCYPSPATAARISLAERLDRLRRSLPGLGERLREGLARLVGEAWPGPHGTSCAPRGGSMALSLKTTLTNTPCLRTAGGTLALAGARLAASALTLLALSNPPSVRSARATAL